MEFQSEIWMLAPRAELPRASNFNDLSCQPDVTVPFDPQRVFPALSNLIVERDGGRYQIGGLGYDAPSPFETHGFAESAATEVSNAAPLEAPIAGIRPTIKIIPEAVNRRGWSKASLPDGTVVVASSRQPFLDAARFLIAAGHDPDSWIEGWRAGATTFALRAWLATAAALTVDETKTVFAKWKPFSRSAVASSIRHSEETATPLAADPSALRKPPLKKPAGTSPAASSAAAQPTAPSTTDHLLRPMKIE